MERFMSREADSVCAPIDGKGYQRADDGSSAVHVAGGRPFPTDTEAMERKLARQKKLLLKERIYKLLYDGKGGARPFSALVAGISAISGGIGLLYGIGEVVKLIFKISNDAHAIFVGIFSLIALAFISGISMGLGESILNTIKKFIKS